MMANRGIFLKKFFVEPMKIGSVTPSSRFLTRRMLQSLDWENIDCVVELGAGTGVFTEYIARHKKPDCKVIVIEQDCLMRRQLEARFPDMLFGGQAENLPFILQKFGIVQADCIVSGLPFAVFSKELQERILQGVRVSLREDGRFVAFQYSLQMYLKLRRMFAKVKLGFELRNFPPAFVYDCRKTEH